MLAMSVTLTVSLKVGCCRRSVHVPLSSYVGLKGEAFQSRDASAAWLCLMPLRALHGMHAYRHTRRPARQCACTLHVCA